MIALLLAAGTAMLVTLFGTPILIRALTSRRIGQQIRDDGPNTHHVKAGTPTMGGIAIVAGVFAGYFTGHLRRSSVLVFTWAGLAVVVIAVGGSAFIGLADDWMKHRNSRSLGLNKRAKIVGLLAVSVGFAVFVQWKANPSTSLTFTRFDSLDVNLGQVGWVILAVLMLVATTNAVNITDGLDGLAAGSSSIVFAIFALIAYWQFRHEGVYCVAEALDSSLIAAAMMGACLGFLWWNAAPAKIFMGDCGALAIGGGIAGLALITNTQLLLPILGGLFVAETASVMIQVVSFRVFHRRLFRMSPVHHHFELKGWPETTVIIRFWIIAAGFASIAFGLFYADYLHLSSDHLNLAQTTCPARMVTS